VQNRRELCRFVPYGRRRETFDDRRLHVDVKGWKRCRKDGTKAVDDVAPLGIQLEGGALFFARACGEAGSLTDLYDEKPRDEQAAQSEECPEYDERAQGEA
jgi:hypothetical protein